MHPMKKGIICCRNSMRLLAFSIKLSWQSSHRYLLLRVFIELGTIALPFISIYLAKALLDILGQAIQGGGDPSAAAVRILLLTAGMLGVGLDQRLGMKASQYLSNMHGEIIQRKVNEEIARQSYRLDIQFFDQPEYYDILSNAQQDAYALQQIAWSGMSFLRTGAQCLAAFVLMAQLNWVFALVFLAVSVPSAAAEIDMQKSMYLWDREHIDQMRRQGYVMSLFSSRQYAKDLRFYRLGDYLFNKYHTLWSLWFKGKRKLVYKKSALAAACTVLPEVATMTEQPLKTPVLPVFSRVVLFLSFCSTL